MPDSTAILNLPFPEIVDPASVPTDMENLADATEGQLLKGSQAVCMLKRDANQSIPNSVATFVNFDTAVYDADGMRDLVLANRITLPFAGIWLISSYVDWTSVITLPEEIVTQYCQTRVGIENPDFSDTGVNAGLVIERMDNFTPLPMLHATFALHYATVSGQHIYQSVYQARTSGASLDVIQAGLNVACLRRLG